MRLIYENEEVSFYLASCNNEQLVISFCPMNHNFNAKGIPGGNVFNKLGYDCLGVIPKRNNWYPRSYMVDGYSAVSKLLSKYKCIISYGSSMGGYGGN